MKKLLAVFFLCLYLFSTTELFQLLKLPILFEHFIDHKVQDNMSFMGYLIHHYGGHEHDEDCWEDDMKLPFIQLTEVFNLSVSVTPSFANFHFSLGIAPQTKSFLPLQDDNLISSYLNTIWQPPKFS